tara:strand:- start:864 stop:1157 length:294 start_codon:yes stop_codon:yes gene_type:complete
MHKDYLKKVKDMEHNREMSDNLFKRAIMQTKLTAFIDPQTAPRSKAIAKLAANHIKWNCDEAYEIAYGILEDCNLHELASDLKRSWDSWAEVEEVNQ